MSASLITLPIEVLEQICLHLPGQEIIKMEAVSRYFRDISRGSTIFQHRREIFTAGLIENPFVFCDLAQRRKAYEEHVHKWSNAGRAVKSVHELPSGFSQLFGEVLGRNLLALVSGSQDDGIIFLRVPSAASQKQIESWSIPPFPFTDMGFTIHLPDKILAVIETLERCLGIHLFNLLDGSPYCPSNIIRWPFPPDVHPISVGALAITSSRLMLHVCIRKDPFPRKEWRINVWDWKTGDLVLGLSLEEKRQAFKPRAVFLDEFRIMVSDPGRPGNPPEFMLFNTLIPQDRPRELRRFSVPQKYRDWFPSVNIDHEMPSGTMSRDEPLVVDSTQAITVLNLFRGPAHVLIVLRTQALIKHACSMGVDTHIPWKELEKDAVVVDVPVYGSSIHVQGTHVVVARMHDDPDGGTGHMCLRVFDCSKRGCIKLRGEGDEAGRKAWYEGGQDFPLGGNENADPQRLCSLANGTFYLEQDFSSVLRVWELI